ncbi:MAG: 4Fe-4S dicluster domain-containing protein [Deltaproteobacteria bacterium]|nr:4Fe-4S dicluster domain-containing protein [Deltaproteobacteria bacterium]
MAKHIIVLEKCRGCGKCVELCSLELWELVDAENGTQKARVIEGADVICHTCLACQDGCPEEAITVIREEE